MLALWLFAGMPFVWVLGIGFGGLAAFAIWLGLNALIFAPVMLAPYGIRRVRAESAA